MILAAPTHSLDPADWFMYCDLLQDAGVPEAEWQWPRRIAESLARDPKLVLINHCPAESLGEHPNNHWLRVGRTWFIGAPGTFIESNRLVWWRVEWVRDGFRRYPTRRSRSRQWRRNPDELIGLNHGTPWELPHPRFNLLLEKQPQEKLIGLFFEGHALADIPEDYL